jgi:hypothetical protein
MIIMSLLFPFVESSKTVPETSWSGADEAETPAFSSSFPQEEHPLTPS